jgi:hypothetical protein
VNQAELIPQGSDWFDPERLTRLFDVHIFMGKEINGSHDINRALRSSTESLSEAFDCTRISQSVGASIANPLHLYMLDRAVLEKAKGYSQKYEPTGIAHRCSNKREDI